MIEVPSAAMLAAEIAARLDFLSIGTNDLTQYALAVDRGNAALAPMQDALHPAVLRLVRSTVLGAASTGTPVAVCGEVAGDPAGALVLVGLGVDDLSVEPGAIGPVRAALAGTTLSDLRSLADAALGAADAVAVRELAADVLRGPSRLA
jgi:phosphocarrier protein FPr